MPVTLKDLAARAGVHPSTVSRVVNNDPRLRISSETRSRIEALLVETQYLPDAVARGLKTKQTFVLAVVIPDVTNSLFAGIFRGVEQAAGERGYSVLLCNTDGSPDREGAHLVNLRARRVDGVVLASAVLQDPSVRWLRAQAIPHVLVNRFSDETHAFVGGNDFWGGRMATQHLIDLGHRRIAHLAGDERTSTGRNRRHGYQVALLDAGIEPEPALLRVSGFTDTAAASVMVRLLHDGVPPTAVFAVNDMAALGALEALRRWGLRVPEELSVIGYDDIPLARHLTPQLTTMRVPVHEFGRESARILIEQIERRRPSRERVIFQPELVARGSTGPRPAGALD